TVCHCIRSRHNVYETQRSRAHSRSEDRDLLELVHQIASNHDLDRERQLRHVATSKRAHQTIERSISTPAIVIFTSDTIETKSYMRHSRAVCLERWPDALEVPAVGDKTDRRPSVADDAQCFCKLRMKRGLASG